MHPRDAGCGQPSAALLLSVPGTHANPHGYKDPAQGTTRCDFLPVYGRKVHLDEIRALRSRPTHGVTTSAG